MMRYMYLIMYLERYVSEMQDTCGIHARYMYLQGCNQDTFGIHPRYMMRIHVSQIVKFIQTDLCI